MRRRRASSLALLVGVAGAVIPGAIARGQERPLTPPTPPTPPAPLTPPTPLTPLTPLTIDEALALGAKNNASLESARTRIDLAEATIRQAWAALAPQVAGQLKYTHNYREVDLDLGPMGTAVILKQEQLDANASLLAPLVAPAAYSSLRAARRARAGADADFAVARAQVLFAVAQAFYLAAGADAVVVARLNAVEVATQTVKDAQTRRTAGAATGVEVQRAEIALVRARQALEEAQYTRGQAYRGLATLIELRQPFVVSPPPAEDVPPAAPAAPAPPPPAADIAQLVAEAVRARPELASLERAIDTARAQEAAAAWRWSPTLSAFGTAHYGNYAAFSGDKGSWAVGVQLDLTYDGGLREAEHMAAAARARDAEARLRLERATVADDVADAQAGLVTRRDGLAAAQREVELAQRTLAQVRVQHEAGVATQLDLLSAQDSLVEATVAVARARFDLSLARLNLARATGTFPPR
jgi:outer membrane protein